VRSFARGKFSGSFRLGGQPPEVSVKCRSMLGRWIPTNSEDALGYIAAGPLEDFVDIYGDAAGPNHPRISGAKKKVARLLLLRG